MKKMKKNESYAAIKTASLCKEIDVLEDNSSKALISLISTVLFSMLPFIKFTFVFKVLPHYWDFIPTYIESNPSHPHIYLFYCAKLHKNI